MRKEISGGMTEQDARSMLKKRGILAFQTLAGNLPQKEPEIANFDDLPTFSVMHQYWYYWGKGSDYRGTHYCIWLKCDEPLCAGCADKIEIWIEPHKRLWEQRWVQIKSHWDDEKCCVCGGICRDDIPFWRRWGTY